MPFVARFEQASGGGGHECHLSFISSRGVVVVGVNAVCRSFRAGKWWWKYPPPPSCVLREGGTEQRSGGGGH